MKKLSFLLILPTLLVFLTLLLAIPVQAQTRPRVTVTPTPEPTEAAATESTSLASASAEAEQKIQEKKDKDITETGGEQKSKLAAYLDENPIGPLSWNNFIQHFIRRSIENGLPANIIVLLLLFPLIASIIAISRHVVGLKGFGIYIPAVLSVAFVSTGIPTGVTMFVAVLLAVVLVRKVVVRMRLPYLPRTAMLLWAVSLFILFILAGSSFFEMFSLLTINIFPLLIIILLTENFMESQFFTSQKEALRLTIETLVIAVLCSLFIGLEGVQKFVLLRPELTLGSAAIINYLLGKYTGLRLLEYFRFKAILEQP